MGGAGAGAFGVFLIPPIFGGAALVWLVATLLAWVLVLQKCTFACFGFFLLSSCLHILIWSAEPSTVLSNAALTAIVPLAVLAVAAIPSILAYRIYTIVRSVMRREL